MRYKAVIFDLDGTLVHTKSDYRYLVVPRALSEFNRTASHDEIDTFWFEPERSEFVRKHFRIEPREFWKVFDNYDSPELRSHYTNVYNDAKIIIKKLKEHGFKIGVVTSAPRFIATPEVGMIGEDLFDTVVIANSLNDIKPKPDPQGINTCLWNLGVPKEDAIFVGNGSEDIIAAKRAQVFDVLVVRGKYDFPNIKPTVKLTDLTELANVLGI